MACHILGPAQMVCHILGPATKRDQHGMPRLTQWHATFRDLLKWCATFWDLQQELVFACVPTAGEATVPGAPWTTLSWTLVMCATPRCLRCCCPSWQPVRTVGRRCLAWADWR
eukprot:1157442-Pelagomonas_calceolata.AAC.15